MPLLATIPTSYPWMCANPWQDVKRQLRHRFQGKSRYSHDRGTIFLLEFPEPATIHNPCNDISHIKGLSEVSTDDTV